MPTSSTSTGVHHAALDPIDARDNVRELDVEHVAALAGSIKLRGLLVPLIVRPTGERFELIAGFQRHAACRQAGLTTGTCRRRPVEVVICSRRRPGALAGRSEIR
jgi:ParB family chromosome partitioning protein